MCICGQVYGVLMDFIYGNNESMLHTVQVLYALKAVEIIFQFCNQRIKLVIIHLIHILTPSNLTKYKKKLLKAEISRNKLGYRYNVFDSLLQLTNCVSLKISVCSLRQY